MWKLISGLVFLFNLSTGGAIAADFAAYCSDAKLAEPPLNTLKALFKQVKMNTSTGITPEMCKRLEKNILDVDELVFGGTKESPFGNARWSDHITDISILKYFPHLVGVIVDYNESVDLSPLKDLPNIKKLHLRGAKNPDLAALENLTQLNDLTLSENKDIVDLAPLRKLINLTYLDLRETGISDLSPLKDLKKIDSLGISDTKVTRLQPLPTEVLQNLVIFVGDRLQLEDWELLKVNTKLDQFDAMDSNISDVGFLANAEPLTRVNVTGAKAVATLAPLSKLKNIVAVGASDTAITDLTWATGWPALSAIYAEDTALKDIAPLSKLYKLKAVAIRGTQVKDVTPLKDHTDLETLDIRNMKLPVEGLQALDSLKTAHKNSLGKSIQLDVQSGTFTPGGHPGFGFGLGR